MMMNNHNTLFYKFKSEKKEHPIAFETTELSIGDIKKIITKRRGLEKCPEPCELLIFDDKTNEEYKNDNIKINPAKKLIIQRIPSYLRGDHRFIPVLRNENQIKRKNEQQQIISSTNNTVIQALNKPLNINNPDQNSIDINNINNLNNMNNLNNTIIYEIRERFNSDHLEKLFNCSQCNKFFVNPVITECCGETFCKSCISNKINCPKCLEGNLKYLPNVRVKELQEGIIKMLEELKIEKKAETNSLQINNDGGNKSLNLNQMNNNNLSNISSTNNQNIHLNKGSMNTLVDQRNVLQAKSINDDQGLMMSNIILYNFLIFELIYNF